MRIRQLALVANELGPVVDDLCAVFGVEVSFNDPSVGEFGLKNALIPFNNRFLEVVSPTEEGTTAGRLLQKRGGDGGYMVLIQVDSLPEMRKHLEKVGVRIIWEIDLPDAATLHLHPKDVGAAIVSFDVAIPPESWRWAGPWEDKIHTDVVKDFAGIEIQSKNPGATAVSWSEVLGVSAHEVEKDHLEIELGGDVIRFVPATDKRGDGLSGIDLHVADREHILRTAKERGLPCTEHSVVIGGTKFRLLD